MIDLNSDMNLPLNIKREAVDESYFNHSPEAHKDLNRVMAPAIQIKKEVMEEHQCINLSKKETNKNLLPDESILSHDHCRTNGRVDADDEQSDTSSDKSNSDICRRKRPGRKKGQTSSVYHLWEFIRDLLKDPKLCDSIIKWENKPEGIFRVVRSTEVANRWGSMKKNKTKMTYEKLSRSLRYSRKEGYFEDLPKNSGYPKKLCFKFGPKSHGWYTN